jgi:hypothetical protein
MKDRISKPHRRKPAALEAFFQREKPPSPALQAGAAKSKHGVSNGNWYYIDLGDPRDL